MSANQCDGCRQGLPVEDGIHYTILEGGAWHPHIGCTASRYNRESIAESAAKVADVQRAAASSGERVTDAEVERALDTFAGVSSHDVPGPWPARGSAQSFQKMRATLEDFDARRKSSGQRNAPVEDVSAGVTAILDRVHPKINESGCSLGPNCFEGDYTIKGRDLERLVALAERQRGQAIPSSSHSAEADRA